MSTNNNYHYILVGFGGAAINLLNALHTQGGLAGKKVLIVEPDDKIANDRTWCFWTNGQDAAYTLNQSYISHEWTQVLLNGHKASSMQPFKYVHLRSGDLYALGKNLIKKYPGITWLKADVHEVSQVKETAYVATADASYSANYVFDSRPPQKGTVPSSEVLWQSFVGWRIKTKKAVFNTELCTLMDFEVPQMEETQFMYVLPTSKNEALIELTRFGRGVLHEEEAKQAITEYLNHKGWQDFEILEKEINKIPMTLGLNPKRPYHNSNQKIIAIGARAGAIKASTGFAFKKIAQHTWLLAQALQKKRKLPTAYHPLNFNLYDELLLRILSERPHLGKPIFTRLFERTPIQKVFKFLDEKSTLLTDVSIMWQMPWQPFLWSLGHTLKGKRSIQISKKPARAH
jgi:lycopene beta-cyclase